MNETVYPLVINADLLEALQRYADSHHTTVSGLLTEAVQEKLKTLERGEVWSAKLYPDLASRAYPAWPL